MEPDVVILGGGIIGLSIARRLASEGIPTTLLERDRFGGHASSAAAGLLVSRAVVRSSVPGRAFYTRSLDRYPDWIADLERESGREVPLRTGDDWCFFCPCSRADRFRERLEKESDPSRWSETGDLPESLARTVAARKFRIFRFREERWVRPWDLLEALRIAAERSGARLVSEAGMPEVQRLPGGGWRLRTGSGTLDCRRLIVAAGPWTGGILGGLGWTANLVPVRGQMVLVPRLHDLEALVHLEDSFYVVPRGELSLVGATSEHGIWDESTTRDGLEELRRRVGLLFPGFDPTTAVDKWAGIRPRTRDRVPHLGWLEPDLLVASGHYRSGVSMAPLTGEVATDLILGRPATFLIADLDPHRRPGGYRHLALQETP